jgi:hypothetical protein
VNGNRSKLFFMAAKKIALKIFNMGQVWPELTGQILLIDKEKYEQTF